MTFLFHSPGVTGFFSSASLTLDEIQAPQAECKHFNNFGSDLMTLEQKTHGTVVQVSSAILLPVAIILNHNLKNVNTK